MLKNVFYVALVAGIFVACAGVKAQPSFSAQEDKGVISLRISDAKDAVPDVAQISFSVETTADTSLAASSENNAISNKVISALKSVLDSKDDMIKTTDFSIRPNYLYSRDDVRKIKNYTAFNSVVVKTKDTGKISKLIDAAVANGANRTNNLSYTFENPEQLCTETYPELMKKLRSQADVLAKAAGTSVTGVKFINASCNSSGARYPRMFMAKSSSAMEDAESNSAPVEAGKVKVNVSVNADFFVK